MGNRVLDFLQPVLGGQVLNRRPSCDGHARRPRNGGAQEGLARFTAARPRARLRRTMPGPQNRRTAAWKAMPRPASRCCFR